MFSGIHGAARSYRGLYVVNRQPERLATKPNWKKKRRYGATYESLLLLFKHAQI